MNSLVGTSVGSYVILDLLGSGAHGSVFRAQHETRGGFAAIKCINASIARQAGCDVTNEVALLKKVQHENVVSFFDHVLQGDRVFLVMEYVPNSSLSHAIKSFPGGRLPETISTLYVYDILSALIHLHRLNIRQGDVKPENCLITSSGVLKLTDFGISCFADDENGQCIGTPNFMAPEQFHKGACLASDIWATGCTIINMRTGQPPYSTLPGVAVQLKQCSEPHPPLYDHASAEEREFLLTSFERDPSLRISAEHLRKHQWLASQGSTRRDRRRDTLWTHSSSSGSGATHSSSTKSAKNGSTSSSMSAVHAVSGVDQFLATDFDDLRRVSGIHIDPKELLKHRRELADEDASTIEIASATASPASKISAATALLQAKVKGAEEEEEEEEEEAGDMDGTFRPCLSQNNSQQRIIDEMRRSGSAVERYVVVAQNGQADYSSLARAVRSAPSGTAIFVEAGDYAELLEFDQEKTLFIAGLGASGAVRILATRSRSRCALVLSGRVWLNNLCFEVNHDAGALSEVLRVAGDGDLTLRQCEVSGSLRTESCLLSTGRRASLRLEACRLSGARVGLRVEHSAQAVVSFTRLEGNQIGLHCSTSCSLQVRSSIVNKNTDTGLLLLNADYDDTSGSTSTTESKKKRRQAAAAAAATAAANGPSDKRSEIIIDESSFSTNRRAIDCSDVPSLSISSCSFRDNNTGLVVRGETMGKVARCTFTSSHDADIELMGGSIAPAFTDNTFTGSGSMNSNHSAPNNRFAAILVRAFVDGELVAAHSSFASFSSTSSSSSSSSTTASSGISKRKMNRQKEKKATSAAGGESNSANLSIGGDGLLNPVGYLDNTFKNCPLAFHVFIGSSTNPSRLDAFVAAVEKQNLWSNIGSSTASTSPIKKVKVTDAEAAAAAAAAASMAPKTPLAWLSKKARKLRSRGGTSAAAASSSATPSIKKKKEKEKKMAFKPPPLKHRAAADASISSKSSSSSSLISKTEDEEAAAAEEEEEEKRGDPEKVALEAGSKRKQLVRSTRQSNLLSAKQKAAKAKDENDENEDFVRRGRLFESLGGEELAEESPSKKRKTAIERSDSQPGMITTVEWLDK